MTLNDRHIKITSFTPSPAHTALKKAVKVAGIALGLVVVGLLWAVLKPICRGVGWIISILTALGIIYWITTLYNIYDYGNEKTFKDLGTASQILRG